MATCLNGTKYTLKIDGKKTSIESEIPLPEKEINVYLPPRVIQAKLVPTIWEKIKSFFIKGYILVTFACILLLLIIILLRRSHRNT
ncbi:MAG TPA: hypothetical protein VF691_12160 [Cytophagaceae bacterium]|jgi:hypothetical protein